jgi:hypothetical protein
VKLADIVCTLLAASTAKAQSADEVEGVRVGQADALSAPQPGSAISSPAGYEGPGVPTPPWAYGVQPHVAPEAPWVPPPHGRSPLRRPTDVGVRIILELFTGALGYAVGGAGGALLGYVIGLGVGDETGAVVGAFTGAILGAGVGIAAGVTMAGNAHGGKGRFWSSFWGQFLGGLCSLAFVPFAFEEEWGGGALLFAMVTFPIVGGIIGYETSHDPEEREPTRPVFTTALTPTRGGAVAQVGAAF